MNEDQNINEIPRTPRSSSLYNRILAIIAVIFVFMATIIAAGILLFVYKHENLFWQERQAEAAHNAGNQVAGYLEKNENILFWLSQFGVDEMLAQPASIQKFLQKNSAFLEIAFLDANGNTLVSAAQNEPILANQFTVRQSQWFREARSGKKHYSRIQTSPKDESYLIFAMPTQQSGVVVAQIKMDGLWQKVAEITFGNRGSVYVTNLDGQIIAHRNSQFVLSNRNISSRLQFDDIRQAIDNEYFGDGEDLNGGKVKIVSTKIKSTRWIVIAELPEEEAHRISNKALISIPLGLILLITISAVTFRTVLRKEFLVPVELLRKGALRLSRGDLAFRHEIPERKDELCQVMEVFNSMAGELQSQQAEQQQHANELAGAYAKIQSELQERQRAEAALKNLNDQLEQRIKERTLSLLQANADLLHEITERKLAEEQRQKLETQLQQAQKMEAIGTLAGGIAHDFNNILGAIIGYAEMIHDDCPADSSLLHDIDQVLQAANRAKELVKQILAFSRQAKSLKFPVQPITIIKEAVKLLRSSIPTTITIEQDIDQDAGVVLADPSQIHQIIMNLCTNAFHAMEIEGGTLTISLHKITLSHDDLCNEANLPSGSFLQLSIKDTGVGIAPEIREKIFDPYFTTKEVGKGTGMGLSMVHGIVQSYGGSISCDSKLGEGTIFTITLPTIEEHALEKNDPTEPAPHGKERILLVDDEEILLEMGKLMLERLGYHVTPRWSGTEALASFQNQPDLFDIVITDQTMPCMTGVDLSRRILQLRPDMPIILCTGYSSLISEEQARSLGIKGFAMKPLAKQNVAKLIRKILDGKRV
ncbi:MAG: response regulator [Proteobacteria bacterium]|nr:response regulator [Pseudomonadota bacterium]